MAQNVYDNHEFFAAYSQLPRQRNGLAGAPEWPAIRAMLPDLAGKRIVDFGCGFGWFGRWAREHGAAQVLGLDLSEKMIARARADTSDHAIDYKIANLEVLELPVGSFDFAYSSLALHYVQNFSRLIRVIYDALVPGAYFLFTIEHPIYMAAAYPRWCTDADGRKTWPVNRYSIEGERRTDWLTKGVVKYHRTMATTLNTMTGIGFVIRHVAEFSPTAEQIAHNPSLAEELERPMILLLLTQR